MISAPPPHYGSFVFILGSRLHRVGGKDDKNKWTNKRDAYDVETGEWEAAFDLLPGTDVKFPRENMRLKRSLDQTSSSCLMVSTCWFSLAFVSSRFSTLIRSSLSRPCSVQT